jgi:alginate O-acetyltransferase complex protein AlgI
MSLAGLLGWHVSSVTMQITLPLGISFYIFQSLTYPLDIYGGKLKPTASLIDFAAFVAFFPKLVAGPITRAREFLPQLERERTFDAKDLEEGCIRILTGFFKKAFIADTLAAYLVGPVFANPGAFSAGSLWLAILGYAIQIYADFSGYSNMAIGSARILGFRLPENFLFPYLAKDFSEFWRRWHITMSTFFRDYIYIPLGGNRLSTHRVLVNLAVTMLICGLWHGAAWTFVCWGGLHGLYLIVQYSMRLQSDRDSHNQEIRHGAINLIWKWSFTQLLVCLAWILFRASDLEVVGTYLTGLIGLGGKEGIQVPPVVWACFFAAFLDHLYGWFAENRSELVEEAPVLLRASVYSVMIVLLFHATPTASGQFIYFQF